MGNRDIDIHGIDDGSRTPYNGLGRYEYGLPRPSGPVDIPRTWPSSTGAWSS